MTMKPSNMTIVQSYMILILPNVMIEPSNVSKKKKKKGTTECDKNIVICDVSTA